jgi:hypothetical protein
VEDVIKYFKAQDITTDPETFFNYYEARGWRGINNWEIAAKSWRDIGYKQNKNKKVSDGLNYEPLLKEYEEVAAASFRRIVEQNANKQH